MTIADSFHACYNVDHKTGCWVWLRARKGKEAKSGGGYGCLRLDGKTLGAHRFSYEQVYGAIPRGLHVMHLCHNTLCVNPAHLAAGSNSDNLAHSARDMRRPHKLTPEQITSIRLRFKEGTLQRVLAAEFGITQGDVSHIVHKHYWKHLVDPS